MGWSGRWALFALALCGWPLRASALPILPSGVPVLLNTDVELLPDGVLIFEQDTGSFPLADEAVTVRDDLGEIVGGTVEAPTADGEQLHSASPELWLWRPLSPLAPARHFTVVASNPSSGESQTSTFVTAPMPSERVIDPAWLEVTLSSSPMDRSTATQCCSRDDDVEPNCFAPELVPEPVVTVTLDTTSPDPVLRQLLFSVTADDALITSDTMSFVDRTRPLGPVLFVEQRAEYCVRISVFDAASRARRELPARCVPNEPTLFEGTVPKDDSQLAGSLIALGCHRPPSGFESAWCRANQSQCFERDGLGCQHFDELCPEYVREPIVDAAVGEGIDTGAAADAGMSIPGESNEGGCAVAGRRAGRAGAGACWLALAALALRRQRATRS